jgi:WD40 repeat protein
VNVDLNDLNDVHSTKSMKFLVTDEAGASLKEQTVPTPTLTAGIAKIALTQTDNMTGSVVVQVTALDGSNTVLGLGTSAVTIVRGKNAGPVVVVVKKSGPGSDGGVSDASAPDLGAPDLAGLESGTQPDATPTNPETDPGVKSDTQPSPDTQDSSTATPDSATPDSATPDSATPDSATPDSATPDTKPPVDVRDTATTTETGPQPDTATDQANNPADGAPDTTPDTNRDAAGTILTALNSCKRYIHYPNSPATCAAGSNQESVIVNSVAFTPDGNYLATAANNSWVKLWKVVDTGLVDTQVVFVGSNFKVTASISPDGSTLAMGNQNGDIVLYDLHVAIDSGAVSQTGTLLASKLSSTPDGTITYTKFTTDGKQLIAMYPSQSSMSDALIVVWDLNTFLPLRQFKRDWQDTPLAVSNSASAGPIWVASALPSSVTTDAGTNDITTVTLEDVSTTGGTKPTFTVPGEVYRIAWPADVKTLAVGTYEGEVGQWDLSNLSNIQRLGSPLVPATSGGSSDSIYGLAYSRDGAFLAVGSWIYAGTSTLRVANLQSRAVVNRQMDFEPRTFAFHPDGTTWAYGLGGCGYVYFCKN